MPSSGNTVSIAIQMHIEAEGTVPTAAIIHPFYLPEFQWQLTHCDFARNAIMKVVPNKDIPFGFVVMCMKNEIQQNELMVRRDRESGSFDKINNNQLPTIKLQ